VSCATATAINALGLWELAAGCWMLLTAGCRMQDVAGWERSIGAARVWVLPRLYLRRGRGCGVKGAGLGDYFTLNYC